MMNGLGRLDAFGFPIRLATFLWFDRHHAVVNR